MTIDQTCAHGCIERTLNTVEGIDDSLINSQPDASVIKDEINAIASRVNNAFEDDTVYSEENNDAVIPIKKELITAATIENLIKRRGWDPEVVRPVLDEVLAGVDHL